MCAATCGKSAKMLALFAATIVLLTACSLGSAHAQWSFVPGDNLDPYRPRPNAAASFADTGGIAFICTGAKDLQFRITATPLEASEPAHHPERQTLLLIVDDEQPVRVAGFQGILPDRKYVAFATENSSILMAKAATAKRRIAVAIEIGGKVVASVATRADGVANAFFRLIDACELPD